MELGTSTGKRVIINYSAGSPSPSDTAKFGVEYARDRNVIIVAAVGNDSNRNIGFAFPVRWPAAYSTEFENVLAVGGIDRASNIASFSNGGPEVNVVAPGVAVRSTVPDYITTLNPTGGQFLNYNGTSMATPHVHRPVALILSINPSLSPQRGTADYRGNGC